MHRRAVADGSRRAGRRRITVGSFVIAAGIVLTLMFVLSFLWRKQGAETTPQLGGRTPPVLDAPLEARLSGLTEEMLNPKSPLRQLRDAMTLGKAFVAVAKENGNYALAWEFAVHVRSCEQLLSRAALDGAEAVKDAEADMLLREIALLVFQARELHYDAAMTIAKLRATMQSLEERLGSASMQSAFFGQLAAEGVPKGLHCLGMRLTMDWAMDPSIQERARAALSSPKLEDNSMYHFCLFTDNVLAASVVVNSTVANMAEPDKAVFHLVTDHMNLGALQAWFVLNPPKGATVEVRSVESMTWLNASYVPVLKQLQDASMQSYYFQASMDDSKATLKFRNPKYLSMLNHLRFYIPEIYPKINRVVFLDDDIVVRKDLAPLFSLDLKGNVNGAVETCLETFHRFYKYLNFSHPLLRGNFDPEACGWAFGMNIFDLKEWRKSDITKIYHHWQEANLDRTLWKLGTLPPGLLTFYGTTFSLERSWHVLGLGYDPNLDETAIAEGAVLHYNGNLKPWLKIALKRYQHYWSEYVNYQQEYIAKCNIH